jgi:hypothetical protein
VRKYAPAMAMRPGWQFQPIAWETYGAFGPQAWDFLQHLSRLCLSSARRAVFSLEAEDIWLRRTRCFLAQRLSVAAVRQHCALIQARCHSDGAQVLGPQMGLVASGLTLLRCFFLTCAMWMMTCM